MFLMTFVVFSDVYSLSIDFEDYSAISIELLYRIVMFLIHLLTLKSIPLFLLNFCIE